MPKFKLLEFKIYEVNKIANLRFKIELNGEIIEHDEMLKYSDSDDISLLNAVEDFIRTKVVR